MATVYSNTDSDGDTLEITRVGDTLIIGCMGNRPRFKQASIVEVEEIDALITALTEVRDTPLTPLDDATETET